MIMTYPLNGIMYGAEDAEAYLCTRTSGVYASDGHFSVSITGTRELTIGKGLAWINNEQFSGKVVAVTEPVPVTIPNGSGTLPRIDRIVLQFDKANKRSQIILKQGAIASNPAAPAIVRTPELYELALYDVSVSATGQTIGQSDIIPLMMDEELCGVMRDGVTGLPTIQIQRHAVELLENVRAESEEKLAEITAALIAIEDGTNVMLATAYTNGNNIINIQNGGTGAATVEQARRNLGLVLAESVEDDNGNVVTAAQVKEYVDNVVGNAAAMLDALIGGGIHG